MLRARVTAQLSGQSSRLKPIAADERMTQPVGVNRDGTLSTYPPVYPVLTVNGKTGEVRLAAKDVGALPAETRIPQNTSDLNNDSGFIGRLTADLENYYRKSETYTRDEIDDRISLIPKFKISVVEALPTANISSTTVYLVKAGNTSGDLYTEYIFTGGAWEILGSQRVDLTGYAKETWVSDLLKGYAKQTEFDALAGKAEETASRTIPTYVLSEGETPEDAPEWAEEVIDPYNDPEGGGTTSDKAWTLVGEVTVSEPVRGAFLELPANATEVIIQVAQNGGDTVAQNIAIQAWSDNTCNPSSFFNPFQTAVSAENQRCLIQMEKITLTTGEEYVRVISSGYTGGASASYSTGVQVASANRLIEPNGNYAGIFKPNAQHVLPIGYSFRVLAR